VHSRQRKEDSNINCFIDIETIPTQPEAETKAEIAKTIEAPATMKKADTIADWHNGAGKYAGVKDAAIEEAYRKTALDGAKGEIISICFADEKDGPSLGFRELHHSEADLLGDVFESICDACAGKGHNSEPYFIGHNVGWDLKFIWHRAVILGVKPPFKLPFGGRHKSDFYDNMQAWAGFGQRISQDNLAKALGIAGKPDDIDGSKVWDFVKAGNVKRVAEYNKYDVDTVIEIYNRINFS
jgi:hypothetical protein